VESRDDLYQAAACQYGPALERLARAYEADAEKRQDLLQEIHFQLWRSFGNFDARCSVRTWAYRVAHHVAASHVIRERRKFATLVSLEELEKFPDKEQGAFATDERRNLERLSALIQQLKPLDRQVIVSYLEDISYLQDLMVPPSAKSPGSRRPAWLCESIESKMSSRADFMKEESMENNPPQNDPKKIWQHQPTEPFKMSVNDIRRRAQRLKTRARFSALFMIAIGLLFSIWFASAFARYHSVFWSIGWGVLSLWGLYGAYQAYRWVWPVQLPPEVSMVTSLQSYRSELERQRDYNRHVWRKSGLPVLFIGLAMALVPPLIRAGLPGSLLKAMPFLILLAIWCAAFPIVRKRRQQKLQQEIDELNEIEKENRA
jgi:RNA polymerase sigma-70 factor (ECF subfamily)